MSQKGNGNAVAGAEEPTPAVVKSEEKGEVWVRAGVKGPTQHY